MGKLDLKRELSTLVQYFIIVAVAGWLAFQVGLASALSDSAHSGTDKIIAINTREAWRNFAPVWREWLTVFVVLAAGRLLVLALFTLMGKRFRRA